jgi:hypothetical protein
MQQDNIQEKYNKIMAITLQKLEAPLDGSEEVLQRIAALLGVNLPPKKKPPISAPQAQPIINRITQAENISNAILFLDGVLQEQRLPVLVPMNVPDPSMTCNVRSRADLEALLDSISWGGGTATPVSVTQPKAGHELMNRSQPTVSTAQSGIKSSSIGLESSTPSAVKAKDLNYKDYAIAEMHQPKIPATGGYSYGEVASNSSKNSLNSTNVYLNATPPLNSAASLMSSPSSSAAGKTGTIGRQAAAAISTSPSTTAAKAGTIGRQAAAAISTSKATTPAANPAAATAAGDVDEDGPIDIEIPKWTKGPPATPEEVDEYKKFMIAKYEAEQKRDAEILRRMKAKQAREGKK